MAVTVNNSIKRNSNDFSFVDRLGSFINNFEWSRGYDDFSQGMSTNKAYLWNVLSAIGNEYGQVIYENVLNYINNAANVDLCKVKALKSMADILGLKYQIFDNITTIPVEVLNTLDVLSINKKYLLDSSTFCSAFKEELSAFPGAIVSDYNDTLYSELCAKFPDPSTGEMKYATDFSTVSTYIDFNNGSNVIDESYYGAFLKKVYSNLINHFIYMQYADVENGISNVMYDYIYQYIADKLAGVQSTTDSLASDQYDKKITELKIKFKLTKEFDPVKIVDEIEYGLDSLDNYDDHEKEVIQVEIDRREDEYQYEKPYNEAEKVIGHNVTRFSYYREKKVKEYFDYVQTTYNNLITATDIESAVRENPSTIIQVYDKDHNYFNLNQEQTYKLLSFDRDTQDITINNNMIVRIVELLAQQTLEIADIREQLKIQMQRTYMKGTFLFLSYVINEYLKYNISNKYGDSIYTQDGATSLRDILEPSIASRSNVNLIEYTDPTEYYNITAPETDLSSENSALVNQKYWQNEYNTIGIDTKDLPLDQISSFYIHQLHLDKRNIDSTEEFLSIIFDFAANKSFLDARDHQPGLSASEKDYTCQLPDKSWIKDPEIEKAKLSNLVLSAQKLNDNIDKYVEAGYELSNDNIKNQMARLSSYISSYYSQEISNANAQVKEDIFSGLCANQETLGVMSDDFEFLHNQFTGLSTDSVYSIFLSSYTPGSISPNVFIKQLEALSNAVSSETHGIKFDVSELTGQIDDLKTRYNAIVNSFLTSTIELSVLPLWPTYYTAKNTELTSQTAKLQTFLTNQSASIQSEAIQHLKDHLNKLINCKEEVNNMVNAFIEVSSMYVTMKEEISSATGVALTSQDSGTITYWDFSKGSSGYDKDTFDVFQRPAAVTAYDQLEQDYSYQAISQSDSITATLDKLNARCHIYLPLGDVVSHDVNKHSTDVYDKVVIDLYGKSKYPSGIEQSWAKYYSDASANKIKADLGQLVTDFGDVLEMANIELRCLDASNVHGLGPISISGVNVDNIGSKLQEFFTAIIQKIKTLDGQYILQNKTIDSDELIKKQKSQTDMIARLLSTTPSPYNIIYVENEFYVIYNEFQKLKSQWDDLLNGYFYARSGTLDDQFDDLIEYIIQRGKTLKDEILNKLGEMRSTYYTQLNDLVAFASGLYRSIVTGVLETKEYTIQTEKFSETIDYLDVGLNAVADWLINSFDAFETSAQRWILIKCTQDPDYILTQLLIQVCYEYLKSDMVSKDLIPTRLDALIKYFNDRQEYIDEQKDFYYAQKRTFLQYTGTELGDDPYFNHKNLTHPSYQIHPYLYNFVKKTNIGYPIANLFHIAFSENYEQELLDIGLDNIIGKYGNIINLWKYGLYDWSGYRSQYEAQLNVNEDNAKESELIGFTGLFYPKALWEYLDNPEVFAQKVQMNDEDSFYFHLNLTDEQLYKIADQLRTYQDQIRTVAQRTLGNSITPSLSGEFDIYKYGEDVYGNSIILIKSYKHLYEEHANDPGWKEPSFIEKKNTPGELWMRIKNHPIAFPAFDLRSTFDVVSQYNVKVELNKKGKKLNDYIRRLNDEYEKLHVYELQSTISNQFLRCFYDMEFDPTNRALLLNIPYRTGTNGSTIAPEVMSYANSSVLVANLEQEFDYNQNINVYSFTYDAEVNVDNIANPGILINQSTSSSKKAKFDFMGFIKNNAYVYAMFIEKQFGTGRASGLFPQTRAGAPVIRISPVGYKFNTKLYKPNSSVAVNDAKYNIFDKSKVGQQAPKFENATNVAVTSDGETITVAYISEQVQPVESTSQIGKPEEPYLQNNTTVINYAEYTPIVEERSISAFGQNTSYPSSTAVLQTQDDQHAVIYNSFDSFTSYIVTMQFKFNGHAIKYVSTKYYNLNTDIGFMPLFADEQGTSRIHKNKSLAGNEQYNFQLQGPEKAEENATPVIIDPADEKYGRVTEDYKEYNKFNAFNDTQISILAGQTSAEYTFELSSVLSAIYDTVKETNQLVKYKYMLMNSKYTTMPIAKGGFNQPDPTGYYYNGFEEFDLLSGQELIGPNGVSFQNVGSTNHINNISSIDVRANIDENTLLPTSISLTCHTKSILDEVQVIDANQFMLMVYNKNNVKAYDFYHLLQNSSTYLSSLLSDELSGAAGLKEDFMYEIDFSDISSLSSYRIPGTTIMPFAAHSLKDDPKFNEISSLLEFKYSEENTVNSEFPYLDSEDIEDEITIVTNDKQYSYFFALDSFRTIQTDIFKMKRFDPETKSYVTIDVNTRSGKYEDFFNRALTIEANYNVEVINSKAETGEPGYYGMVLYFNYKDFTETPYIKFTPSEPPEWKHYEANDDDIKHTFLRLEPGQSGRLDLLVDYLEFDKLNPSSITQTVVGKESRVIASYYILNVSQDKPKFKISRTAFNLKETTAKAKVTDEEAYSWYRPDDNDGSGEGGSGQNEKYSIDLATVIGVDEQYQYTGNEIKPKDMTVALGNTVLIQSLDYDVMYPSDNYVNVSPAKKAIRLIGKNSTFSYKDVHFAIVQRDIDTVEITGVQSTYIYTGSAIEPAFELKFGDLKLIKGTDFTVQYTPDDHASPGLKEIVITGKGNFGGVKRVQYKVTADIEDTTVIGIKSRYEYNGKEQKPPASGITVMMGDTEVDSSMYTISYPSDDYTNPGVKIVRFTGKDSFHGQKDVTFEISRDFVKMTHITGKEFTYFEEDFTQPFRFMNADGTIAAPFNKDFGGKTNLTKVEDTSKIISQLADGCFTGCASLTAVDIQGVIKAGKNAFESTGLTSISLPECTTFGGEKEFAKCYSLKSVSVPKLTSDALYTTFVGCEALTSIYINSSRVQTIENNTLVVNSGSTKLIAVAKAATTSINNSDLTSVGPGVFDNRTSTTGTAKKNTLANVNLPNVKEVGAGAFADAGLTSVYIPAITKADEFSFYNCKMATFHCPSLTSVGQEALENTSLTSFSPTSLQYVANDAFKGSAQLASVTLPAVKSLGDRAFQSCTSLTACTIGSSATSVGSSVFSGCASLRNLHIAGSSLSVMSTTALAGTSINNLYLDGIEATHITSY